MAESVSIETREQLLGVAAALGVAETGPLSPGEQRLLARAPRVDRALSAACRRAIGRGEDPLGEAFAAVA
ncbi:MAG: class I SAM-dependent methyltransferase, partial [Myxococcota bacterium]|nr:class I SAM-dependent methyltransferase [Myxococcota bacterium]